MVFPTTYIIVVYFRLCNKQNRECEDQQYDHLPMRLSSYLPFTWVKLNYHNHGIIEDQSISTTWSLHLPSTESITASVFFPTNTCFFERHRHPSEQIKCVHATQNTDRDGSQDTTDTDYHSAYSACRFSGECASRQ